MKNRVLFLFLLIIPLLKLYAVSLDQCIEAGVKNSLELETERERRRISSLQKKQAYYSFIPSINLNSGMRKQKDIERNGDISLSVSENLYLFDDRFYNLSKYHLNHKSTEITYLQNRKQTVIKIIKMYADILILENYNKIYQSSIDRYKKDITLTKELIKTGKKTELDLYSLKIELKDYEKKLTQNKADLKQKKTELKQITQLEKLSQLEEISKIDESFPQSGKFNENLDLKYQLNQIELTEIEKKNAFANIIPDLYASASYNKSQNYNFKENDSYTDTNWEISLNASYPLGNIPERFTDFKISKKNLRIERLNRKILKDNLNLEFENKLAKINLNKTEMKLDKERQELAKKNLELAKNQYRSGLISLIDYSDARNKMIQSEIDYLTSKYELIKSIAEMQYFTGSKILGKY